MLLYFNIDTDIYFMWETSASKSSTNTFSEHTYISHLCTIISDGL